MKVLIVDDHDANLKVLSVILKKSFLGLLVDCAENGRQAVDLALETKYDLILMDINMPVMDGCEATRKIREAYDHQNIIAMTAVNKQRLAEIAEMKIFELIISKPFNPSLLIETLKDYLPASA